MKFDGKDETPLVSVNQRVFPGNKSLESWISYEKAEEIQLENVENGEILWDV